MACATIEQSEDNLTCSICLELLVTPVVLPCGHNFCRDCISNHRGNDPKCKCPLCTKEFTQTDLEVNIIIRDLVDDFKKKCVEIQDQPCVEPGEVPCDMCTGRQQKAVKSCLECAMSYCHAHLERHSKLAGTKKHQLVAPTDRLQDWMCEEHDRLLEFFCKTDQECLCARCLADHTSHPVVSLKEAHEEKTVWLGKNRRDYQQMIQERKSKIQEIQEIQELLTVLTKDMKRFEHDLIRQLQKEIDDLTKKESEAEQLSTTEDHAHFLKTCRSLEEPPVTRDSAAVQLLPQSYQTLRTSLDQLVASLNAEKNKLQQAVLRQYACQLTLDPNTANRELSLSEDNRKVTTVNRGYQQYADHPERFDCWLQLLCCEALPARCYLEVEWKGGVGIAVACRDMARRGIIDDSWLGRNNKSWCLYCYDNDYEAYHNQTDDCYKAWYNNTLTGISLRPAGSTRVAVYVDQPEGTLSFYRVDPHDHTLNHIHTFHTTFTQPILAGFKLDRRYGGYSVSLCAV